MKLTLKNPLQAKACAVVRALLFFTQQHGENNLFEVFPRD
jgi:hypothetical protein